MRTFDSPIGRLTVAATSRGLARVLLPGESAGRAPRRAEAGSPGTEAEAEREILEYLNGRRRAFTVPVDLSGVPPFHRKVLDALAQVPYGQTVTYADLARRAGKPLAARAIGQAMARNPVPLVIPCHRVVASGGGLGGYGGGLDLKRRLLALECAAIVQR